MNALAGRVKKIREEKGWSQTYVANQLKIHPATYSNYEQGRRDPDFETVRAMARLFECSVEYLIGETCKRDRQGPALLPPDIELVFRDVTWDELQPDTQKDLAEYIRWRIATSKKKQS